MNSGSSRNPYFELRGISHLALVSSDMARTVDFYQGVLGMPLIMTLGPAADEPDAYWNDSPMIGAGTQHFFFDMGNGDCLAFFWFPNGRPSVPGVSNPGTMGRTSADGSMHHLAMEIPQTHIADVWRRFEESSVPFQFVTHSLTELEAARHSSQKFPGQNRVDRYSSGAPIHTLENVTEDTFLASYYFSDPDGIQLEFAAWCEPAYSKALLTPQERPTRTNGRHTPTPAGG